MSALKRAAYTIQFGTETIDLSAISQLVDDSQTRALAAALIYGWKNYMDGKRSLAQILIRIMADIENNGLDTLDKRPLGDHAQFRIFELGATLNRLRTLSIKHPPNPKPR